MLSSFTAFTAAQDAAATGDGGCLQIAKQLPHAASTNRTGFGGCAPQCDPGQQPQMGVAIAATTGLVIATSDNHINNHIQSPTFVRDSGRGSNVGLGIELGAAGIDSSWNWY
jgi:hypothetical protein